MVYRNVFYFVTLFTIIFFLIGCSEDETVTGGGNGGGQNPNEIIMTGSSFSPANITINAGTTIKWVNKENIIHNVISGTPGSPSGVFSSGDLVLNGEFSFTFNQAGTFNYFCSYHPGMAGVVTVQ